MLRNVVLPVVGGLVIGGWLFLKWDAYRVKQVQVHLLLEKTGLELNESYQITEYEQESDWGDWKLQNGQYEFSCTHAECQLDPVFGHYDPKTRELSRHQIHL